MLFTYRNFLLSNVFSVSWYHVIYRVFWSSVSLYDTQRHQSFISIERIVNLVVCHSPVFVKHFPWYFFFEISYTLGLCLIEIQNYIAKPHSRHFVTRTPFILYTITVKPINLLQKVVCNYDTYQHAPKFKSSATQLCHITKKFYYPRQSRLDYHFY